MAIDLTGTEQWRNLSPEMDWAKSYLDPLTAGDYASHYRTGADGTSQITDILTNKWSEGINKDYASIDPTKFKALASDTNIHNVGGNLVAKRDYLKPVEVDSTNYLVAGTTPYTWDDVTGAAAMADSSSDLYNVLANIDKYKKLNDTVYGDIFLDAASARTSEYNPLIGISGFGKGGETYAKRDYTFAPSEYLSSGYTNNDPQWLDPYTMYSTEYLKDPTKLSKEAYGVNFGGVDEVFTDASGTMTDYAKGLSGAGYLMPSDLALSYLGLPRSFDLGLEGTANNNYVTPITGLAMKDGKYVYMGARQPGIGAGGGNAYALPWFDEAGVQHGYTSNPYSEDAAQLVKDLSIAGSLLSMTPLAPIGAGIKLGLALDKGDLTGAVMSVLSIPGVTDAALGTISDALGVGASTGTITDAVKNTVSDLTGLPISTAVAGNIVTGLTAAGSTAIQGGDFGEIVTAGVGAGLGDYAGGAISNALTGTGVPKDYAAIAGNTGGNVVSDIIKTGGDKIEDILISGAASGVGTFASKSMKDWLRDEKYADVFDNDFKVDEATKVVTTADGTPAGWFDDEGNYNAYSDVNSDYGLSGGDVALSKGIGKVVSGYIRNKGEVDLADLLTMEVIPVLAGYAEDWLDVDIPDFAVKMADQLVDAGVKRSIAEKAAKEAQKGFATSIASMREERTARGEEARLAAEEKHRKHSFARNRRNMMRAAQLAMGESQSDEYPLRPMRRKADAEEAGTEDNTAAIFAALMQQAGTPSVENLAQSQEGA